MKKNLHYYLLLMLAALVTLPSVAAVPSGYYDNAKNKSDQALMTALHTIIKGHTKRSYSQLWTDFRTTDCNGNIIIDRYSDTQFTYNTDKCGSNGYSQVGDCYNREHSIPNSWWGGSDSDTAYTDLHHMFPVDGWVNNERGNHPFGNCANGTPKGTGKLGTCTFSGYSGTVFEVADEYKGDFARVYFYFATRYMMRMSSYTSGTSVFNSSTYLGMDTWAINQLLEWHRNDPVSTLEITRNDNVYSIQHNRNPYVDNPELVEYIWGNMKGQVWNPSGTTTPTLTSPVSGSTINVGTNTGSGVSKTITVKGTNLTKSVTVSVSGSGFSVTPTTLTASAVNAGTTITVTYNGTTTNATGSLSISSSEVSSSCTLTATYNTGGGGSGTETIETWEGCSGYENYTNKTVQGKAFTWYFSNAGIFAQDNDHWNDAIGCRFGKNTDSYIEMSEDVSDGASKLTFYAARYGNDTNPTVQLQYSTNGGSTWTTFATCSPNGTWQQYTYNLDITGNVRFKFAQTAGSRLNIDDIAITSNAGTVTNPQITAPTNGSTVNVGTIAATGTSVSKTITVKGSDLTKALNVSVSGTGFSVTPTTISAANANNGTTVTVTYTSSTSGSATGTLTISSSEASVTVNLTASKTANPQITSPTNGSTVNVGTIPATGTSVSKSITVKGSDLTKALNVGVSGTGFSVTPTTISAGSANNGTTVTVTYTSSTAGNATGTLTISSSEVSVTVNLTASKVAMPTISITPPAAVQAEQNGASTYEQGSVSADNNSTNITLSVEGNFELSLNRFTWSKTLTLDPTGEVFYIRLADTGTAGDYYGTITATTGVVNAYADVEGTVTAQTFKPGDVNMDGEVDINDVTALIAHVLGQVVSPFDSQAANLNGDNEIDINDVTQLIAMVLGVRQNALTAGSWDAVPVQGGILVENYSSETLEIYDMDAECAAVVKTNGEVMVNLPAGIYVVSGDTVSRKVVVK